MDKILHKIANHNQTLYQSNGGNDPLLLDAFKLYSQGGYNDKHANFMKENCVKISIQGTEKLLNLVGLKYADMIDTEQGKQQINNIIAVFRYILGVNPNYIEEFKFTLLDLNYIEQQYPHNKRMGEMNVLQQKVIQYVYDIFDKSHIHTIGEIEDVSIINIIKIIKNISYNKYNVQEFKSTGVHSFTFSMDLNNSLEYPELDKHVIAKLLFLGIKSKKNICDVSRKTFYKYREIVEILVNIIISIYTPDHVSSIINIHILKYKNPHSDSYEMLLCPFYKRIPYLLSNIMHDNKITKSVGFNNILKQLIEISYELYNIFGLIHCDLKPENILIDTDDPIKIINGEFKLTIIDFGLSYFNKPIDMNNINPSESMCLVSGYDISFFLLYCYKYYSNTQNQISVFAYGWIQTYMKMVTLHMIDKSNLNTIKIMSDIDIQDTLDLYELQPLITPIATKMAKHKYIWMTTTNLNINYIYEYKHYAKYDCYKFADKCLSHGLFISIDVWKNII